MVCQEKINKKITKGYGSAAKFHTVNDQAKNRERKIFPPKKRKTIRFIIFVNGFRYAAAILLNAGLI